MTDRGARSGSGSPWWRPRLGVLAAVGMVLVAGLLASAASAESSGRYRWDFPRAAASDDPVDDADRADVAG